MLIEYIELDAESRGEMQIRTNVMQSSDHDRFAHRAGDEDRIGTLIVTSVRRWRWLC